MSKFGMLVAAVLLAGVGAFAQGTSQSAPAATSPKDNHRDRAEQKLKRLSKRLNLTGGQQEKVRPILQDEEKQLTSLESDGSLTQQQKRRKMREIRMTSRSQIDSILTPEQKETIKSERGDSGRRHHERPGSAKPANTDPDSQQ